MATKYRAEQVGSFLRPPQVKQAHTAYAAGKLSLDELRMVEDKSILQLLQMQREVGIDVFSDGEWRRGGWSSGFADSLASGYVDGTPSVRLQFQANPIATRLGTVTAEEARQTALTLGGGAGGRVLGAPIVPKQRIAAHEAAFLKANAPGPFKVTMAAPSYLVARAYNPAISDRAFGSHAGTLHAVAEVIREEIRQLVEAGVPYIQLDNPHYPDYVVEERRQQWRAAGVDPDQALREDVEADNYALGGCDRSRVTLAMHFCRGNGAGGGWHSSGGYERIAEACFGHLDVDTFLLEYDSDRAGGFEPLRFVPKGKTVVLGLVTTKFPELESTDSLIRRIEAASQYVALDDLALSPQCGFASTFQGNALTPEEQRAKLALVVETARKVWGT